MAWSVNIWHHGSVWQDTNSRMPADLVGLIVQQLIALIAIGTAHYLSSGFLKMLGGKYHSSLWIVMISKCDIMESLKVLLSTTWFQELKWLLTLSQKIKPDVKIWHSDSLLFPVHFSGMWCHMYGLLLICVHWNVILELLQWLIHQCVHGKWCHIPNMCVTSVEVQDWVLQFATWFDWLVKDIFS